MSGRLSRFRKILLSVALLALFAASQALGEGRAPAESEAEHVYRVNFIPAFGTFSVNKVPLRQEAVYRVDDGKLTLLVERVYEETTNELQEYNFWMPGEGLRAFDPLRAEHRKQVGDYLARARAPRDPLIGRADRRYVARIPAAKPSPMPLVPSTVAPN